MTILPDDMKYLINYDEKIIWTIRANDTVVVSNQRLIIRRSGGLGLRKSFVDYPYSNMVNIQLDKGVRRSSVEISMRSGVQTVKIAGLSKTDAYQLHRIVRENIVHSSETSQGTSIPMIIAPRTKTEPDSMKEQKCLKCRRTVAADFSLCPFCGYTLKHECPECGKQFDRKYKMCPYCGERLISTEDMDFEY